MKNIILLLAMFLAMTSVIAQDFITTWKTDNPGTSNTTSITIPTYPTETYNYDVDWDNDGTFDEFGLTGNVTHDFGVAGTYTIRIRGPFPRIYFWLAGDTDKILSVDNWGTNPWTSMSDAFSECHNLVINATDTPNLSNVTDMSWMFLRATSFNQDIGDWDVSNVTDMFAMFHEATSFNQDISNWDVSNVTDMGLMFFGTNSFNQDISDWDVSNVTYMGGMFRGAISFNQDIGNWDVSEVVIMRNMFRYALSFNQDIGKWDVGEVTGMNGMFRYATSFNQDIGKWDVGEVIWMYEMFRNATSFNQDIGKWDVGEVIDMWRMFNNTTSFNQDIHKWDVSNVLYMSYMFDGAESFDQDIGDWDVCNVRFMWRMFNGATLSSANYDSLLIGWDALDLHPYVDFDGGNSIYCSTAAQVARANMIASDNWTITDGGVCVTNASIIEPIPDLSVGMDGLFNEDDYENNFNVQYWPNPSNNYFNLKFNTDFSSQVGISVYDINGRLVHQRNEITTNTYRFGESLKSGIYFVKFDIRGEKQLLKLVKY